MSYVEAKTDAVQLQSATLCVDRLLSILALYINLSFTTKTAVNKVIFTQWVHLVAVLDFTLSPSADGCHEMVDLYLHFLQYFELFYAIIRYSGNKPLGKVV